MSKKNEKTVAEQIRANVDAAVGNSNIVKLMGKGTEIRINEGREQNDGSLRFTIHIIPPFKRENPLTTTEVRNGEARAGETILIDPMGFGPVEAKVLDPKRKNYVVATPNGGEVAVPFEKCAAVEMLNDV